MASKEIQDMLEARMTDEQRRRLGEEFDRTEMHGIPASYAPTPAQVTMRREMQLDTVLDTVVGKQSDDEIAGLALAIISQAPNLALSLKQWHTVQGMVEEGIRQGRSVKG